VLINLLPDFLAVLDAANPEAAYQQYRDAHRPILDAYWHNYVLDPDSAHADGIVANALKAPRDDLRALMRSTNLEGLAEETIGRAEELLQIDRPADCYLMVGVGGANAGELVVGGRGIAFVCLEHFTGRANPDTYGMGLPPDVIPLWLAHELAHTVRYTSPASQSEMRRLVADLGGYYDYWQTGSRATLRELLVNELTAVLGPDMDRTLGTHRHAGLPGVVLVVGVNGAGKTTTVGKIARVLVGDGKSVVLGAADTFRAAAADQLETWGERVGVLTVRGREGGDPASVAFEAVRTGAEAEVDTVVVDTAGRLHTKAGLMDELGKIKRVVEKQCPVTETLLVLDATTGQNGVVQARVFTEAVEVTGIVLTKLDGTAKGGIVVSVQRELGIPVKLIGLGEGPDDLAPFEPEAFVDALLGD